MKGTNIDGDLSVGRNIVTGGNITSQGGALFKGGVHIAGWLDAKNIKWANKGLFASENELEEVYPKPLPGWYAIVIDQEDETKGFLYRALDGAWVVTSDTSHPYEFIMDSINVFVPKSDFDTLSLSVEKNSSDIEKFITGQTPVETARKLLTGLAYNGYVTPDTTLPVVDNVFYLTATAGDYIDREDNVISVHTEGVTLIQRKKGEWKTYALWELVSELNNASKTRFASAYAVKKLKDMIDQLAAGGGGGGSITVDSELSESSINPVQNAVITEALNELVKAIEKATEDNSVTTDKIADYAVTEEKLALELSNKIDNTKVVADKAAAYIGVDHITLLQGGIDPDGSDNTSSYFLRTSRFTTFKLEVNNGYTIGQVAQYDLAGNFVNLYNDYTQSIVGVEWNPTSVVATDKNYYWVAIIFKGNSPTAAIYPRENVVKSFASGLYYYMEGDETDPQSAAAQAKTIVNGTIEQLPNEEDLTLSEGKMQLANRAASVVDGKVANLGYVILRPDRSFAEQVVDANAIYEIRYEYSIDSDFSMPNNCSLKFDGGKIIINNEFNLNNVEISDNANILYIGENGSLSGIVKNPIKLSQVGAIGANDTEYNRRALQALVDAGVKIIVDNSATFSDAIRIKTKINIEELINKDTTLSFPNSKGFVWDASVDSEYSPNNYVKGFTIRSKDNCFDFYNEGGNRFNNVHQSSFINLDCISSEGYCFFAGNGKGANGDQLTFGNNWKNILIKAPLKSGFFGVNGIENEFSDVRCHDCAIAHFENCNGRFIRCQGSFGKETTPHFLKASATESEPSRLKCIFEMCNFENYINSVISANNPYVYLHLSFSGCSFSPKGSDAIDYHLIDTYYLYNLVWQNTRVVKENFATGKGYISNHKTINCQFLNDKDLIVYDSNSKRRITIYAGTETEMCHTTDSDWGAKYYKKHRGLLVDELFITDTKVKGKTLNVVNNSSLNLFGAEKFYLKASNDTEGSVITINNFTFGGNISGDDNILKRIVLQNTSKNATITIYHGLTGYGNIIISETGKHVTLKPKQFVECEIIGNAGGNTNIGNGIADDKDIILYIKSQINNFRKIGSSEQKPTGIDAGFRYFNSELNKEEIWNGEEWIDNNSDRAANTTDTSKPIGLGYKTLSPNKSFIEQVVEPNTIYEIRNTFDIITIPDEYKIPDNCILRFKGGSLNINLTSGQFKLNNVYIDAPDEVIIKLSDTSVISGSIKNNEISAVWFNIINDGLNKRYILNQLFSWVNKNQTIRFKKGESVNVTLGGNDIIRVQKDNITIKDAVFNIGSCYTLFYLTANNITFDNCSFIGTKGVNCTQIILLGAVNNILVTNCYFSYVGYGIIQSTGKASNNVTITGCVAENMTRDFIEANCTCQAPSYNWIIQDNVYLGDTLYPNANMQEQAAAGNTSYLEHRFAGITDVKNINISNNIIKNSAGDAAIHIEEADKDVIINGNHFENCAYKCVWVMSANNRTVVSNNIFRVTDADLKESIFYTNDGNEILSDTSGQNLFVNNHCTGNKIGSIFCTNVSIIGNIFDTIVNIKAFRNTNITANKFINCENCLVAGGNHLKNISYINNTDVGTEQASISLKSNGVRLSYITIKDNVFSGTVEVGDNSETCIYENNVYTSGQLVNLEKAINFNEAGGVSKNNYIGNCYHDNFVANVKASDGLMSKFSNAVAFEENMLKYAMHKGQVWYDAHTPHIGANYPAMFNKGSLFYDETINKLLICTDGGKKASWTIAAPSETTASKDGYVKLSLDDNSTTLQIKAEETWSNVLSRLLLHKLVGCQILNTGSSIVVKRLITQKTNNPNALTIESDIFTFTKPVYGQYNVAATWKDIFGNSPAASVGETRPSNVNIGFQFFDMSLLKPIWWTGEKWVDSTGTEV